MKSVLLYGKVQRVSKIKSMTIQAESNLSYKWTFCPDSDAKGKFWAHKTISIQPLVTMNLHSQHYNSLVQST